MSAPQLARARRKLGKRAFVQKRPSWKWRNGNCITCGDPKCQHKYEYAIGTLEMDDLVLNVWGRGHSWEEAWERLERKSN